MECSPPQAKPLWFTFSVSLCLAQSHMSLGTESLKSQGGIVLVVPQKCHLYLSPNLNSKSLQWYWVQIWDLPHHNPMKSGKKGLHLN